MGLFTTPHIIIYSGCLIGHIILLLVEVSESIRIPENMRSNTHVSKLCQSCYFQLRQIRTIRHSLSPSAIRTLVHAFICSRIDFSNSLLYGTSTYLLDRLQSVLNSSARLILKLGKYDPISAAIRRDLHWLPIQARIRFKMNVITRNCLVG